MKPPPEGRVREVLVLGATGYVGGRLVSELLDAGHQVRVLTRSPDRAERYEWSGRVRLFTGDVLDAGTLAPAFEGCDAVYYLVHSIGTSGDFAATEAIAARRMRATPRTPPGAAASCISAVWGRGDALSTHLASRHQVGEILASGSTPTTELRAAVIIGAGSISFEMLRYLTEVLPAMVTPRWVRHEVPADCDSRRPRLPRCGARGCRDHRSRARHRRSRCGHLRRDDADLRRGRGTPPPLHPAGAVPLPEPLVPVGRPGHAAPRIDRGPSHRFTSSRGGDDPPGDRLARASSSRSAFASPSSSRCAHASRGDRHALDRHRVHARRHHSRRPRLGWRVAVRRPPDGRRCHDERGAVRARSRRIGGEHGYYVSNWAWSLRGLIDKLVGGPGLRRGRRHPLDLRRGDALDFWRVVDAEPGLQLVLQAEMKLPGKAWLTWRIELRRRARQDAASAVAYFAPRGLWGACTGTRCSRFTRSSSAAWRTRSPTRRAHRVQARLRERAIRSIATNALRPSMPDHSSAPRRSACARSWTAAPPTRIGTPRSAWRIAFTAARTAAPPAGVVIAIAIATRRLASFAVSANDAAGVLAPMSSTSNPTPRNRSARIADGSPCCSPAGAPTRPCLVCGLGERTEDRADPPAGARSQSPDARPRR